MSEKFTVTYSISDEGWVYTDSFGVAMLEGRTDRSTGITEKRGRRILTLPDQVDGIDVYIVGFDGEYDDTVTDIIVSEGIGIIGPHAFRGWKKLRRIRLPDSLQEISGGALSGTSIPHRVQRKLYERTLDITEMSGTENGGG